MSEKYKVVDSSRPTFISVTIMDWVDLLTRKRYCIAIDESLNYCTKEKGFIVHAYVYFSSYIHLNPVEAGLVFRPEEYMYSSSVDYLGEKGLLNDIVVVK